MDVVDIIKKDKAYVKCKLIVKTWEKDFKTKYSRTPSKFDIKEAPSKIKYAYKKYFQLKSAALQNSVYDIEEESSEFSEFSQHLENVSNEPLSPQSEQLPTLPNSEELGRLLSNVHYQDEHNTVNVISPFSDSLSKKLFQNRKFSLRNPRKLSLSKSQSVTENKSTKDKENYTEKSYSSTSGKECEHFNVSLTTVNESKANNKICTDILLSKNVENSLNCKNSKVRQLNEGWLERATGLNIQHDKKDPTSSESTVQFGLTNITVNKVIDKPCDYVENSESEEDVAIDKLKPALKKRKIETYNNSRILHDRHKKSDVNRNTTAVKNSKINKNHKSNKRELTKNDDRKKEQQPPDITEYLPFGLEDNIIPRHSKISDSLKTVETVYSNKIVDSGEVKTLEKKIKNGTLNDNFIKINIEKKVFVRGKKNLNFSKYKKQLWKDKKASHASMEFPESGKISCFKCGTIGHMARYCTSHKEDSLLPLESYNDDQIPTLQDMQNIVNEETNSLSLSEQLRISAYKPSKIPDSFMSKITETSSSCETDVKPIYFNVQQETPQELYHALHMFGHESFRDGQEQAIMRILCGKSTLLILSTGGGKSLCYQLPAYIYSQHYKCITLVISPLVSLMEDQVLSMPEFLKAGCLHTNQPLTQRHKIIQSLKEGKLNILLISPEAIISGDSSNGFAGLFKSLPQIAFACIDEAHCVSQWSHNFRPSYLMICRILREKLNVRCILGLTATASQATIKSVITHLDIPDGLAGVIKNPTLPDNLYLSVSLENDKDKALVSFLTTEPINSFNSIIVYCIRRDECVRVAAVLRSCLQEPGKIHVKYQSKKRKRISYIAEAYHAGMSASQRKNTQKRFMDGSLRIIVATVAFGMGINKSDIRCIIHYNMPSSFESYVQEVGRAGRDGQKAYCHVFMNKNNSDKNELLKHIHANSIDRPIIRRLLQKVFIPCECLNLEKDKSKNSSSRCKGHEVGIPIDSTIEELDLPSENIATLLCYIELHPKQYIKVLNNAYTVCKISSYAGPTKILEAAKTCAPLAMAYILSNKSDPNIMKKTVLEFPVIDVAAAIGWESGMTKYHLKNLEWITEGGVSKRSHLKVEFTTLGFRIKAPGDLTAAELDSVLDDLHELVLSQEKAMLYQLEESQKAFSNFANGSIDNYDIESLLQKSNGLKHAIRNYFQRENNIPVNITLEQRPLEVERVISDIRALISSYKDCSFTGRSIARIFQGISSPNYPAIVWGRCKFWRSHIHEDFYGLIKIATQQIIQMKL